MMRRQIWWSRVPSTPMFPFVLLSLFLALFFASPVMADSCIDCHKDSKFRVTNKKIFDYYQNWQGSVHATEGVSCADCHGGNPKLKSKKAAHVSAKINPSQSKSPVHFRNIPATCSSCHEEYYDHFRKSKHFEKLSKSKEKQQGPNCVTCHASVNTAVLNVNTVREACAFCHNVKEDNHPEIPDKAEALLGQFLSIHRFYRYLTVKGGVDQTVFMEIEKRTNDLFVDWHSFDLPTIETRTNELLTLLKEQRDIIRKKNKKKGG